jgi:hypothetical protein
MSQVLYSNLGGRRETLCLDFKCLLETPPILYQLKKRACSEKARPQVGEI